MKPVMTLPFAFLMLTPGTHEPKGGASLRRHSALRIVEVSLHPAPSPHQILPLHAHPLSAQKKSHSVSLSVSTHSFLDSSTS